MQAYISDQPREQIGAPLHDRFTAMLRSGTLITPRASADSMIARLAGQASGEIWDVSDAIPAP